MGDKADELLLTRSGLLEEELQVICESLKLTNDLENIGISEKDVSKAVESKVSSDCLKTDRLEAIYEFMTDKIYKSNKADQAIMLNRYAERPDFTSRYHEVGDQERIFLAIDNKLNHFLGCPEEDRDLNNLDNNLTRVKEKSLALQEEGHHTVYHEFFVERTIKNWLLGERTNAFNPQGKFNQPETGVSDSFPEPSLAYSEPEINEALQKKLAEQRVQVSLPIKVDMRKIRSQTKAEMDKQIVAVNALAKFIVDGDKIKAEKASERLTNFIFVCQRQDGMVTVVGKSSFNSMVKQTAGAPAEKFKKGIELDGGTSYLDIDLSAHSCGDLYQELNLGNGSAGTERIILSSLFGSESVTALEALLKNYYKTAWLIPIPADASSAKRYEKQLGNYLLANHIPILNKFSHN